MLSKVVGRNIVYLCITTHFNFMGLCSNNIYTGVTNEASTTYTAVYLTVELALQWKSIRHSKSGFKPPSSAGVEPPAVHSVLLISAQVYRGR